MGFYSRHVLPRVIDWAMRNPEAGRMRREWVPRAAGEVLEIGFGSGLNLPFYGAGVRRVYGLDPSAELREMAAGRAAGAAVPLVLLGQAGEERVPLEDGSIDTVVMTWTLCSVADPGRVLGEARRVCRPGGGLVFVEHGLAAEPAVARRQRRMTRWWRHVAGGCRLDRDVPALLAAAGWRVKEMEAGYLAGPRAVMYTYRGWAGRGE